ncbi:hypothetical protein [uncultured Cohaesibacter sp.]|uniref:hypothetical protein n=1 Tax=uncultured Cohaesibacter sp. TaxID=1002546 RepID=UPI0029C7805A|nr:hypothetical protein [uncultured Cohaesibacter sp.]
MHITERMNEIRNRADYIEGSVHWNRRAYDKAYEIVARLHPEALVRLGSTIGGEVVLDVRQDRRDALAAVRFFRRQEN